LPNGTTAPVNTCSTVFALNPGCATGTYMPVEAVNHPCPGAACTQKDCCLPKAKCSDFKCASGSKSKTKVQWIVCAVDPCLADECCDKDDGAEKQTDDTDSSGANSEDSGDGSLHVALGLLFCFAIAVTVVVFLRGKKKAQAEKADLTRTRMSMDGRCDHARFFFLFLFLSTITCLQTFTHLFSLAYKTSSTS
jgi:hypothetical protein